ncbi:hypothetical protein P3T23_009356 [Paraburkholderia sp. GAS448]|uniref:hypothetical protein n=1 Tax=Paraburkholderia sp. GAS448 TaxID=3035136 RepID=UPI003D243F68
MPLELSPMQGYFVVELAKSGALFLVIGGKAMQTFELDRPTDDLDLWISRDDHTTDRVYAALQKFCGAPAEFRERLRAPNVRVPIPTEANPEIDILTSIDGMEFENVNRAARDVVWKTIVLRVPSSDDLIRCKQIAIASTEARIASGEWNPAGVEEARRGITRDERDIELLRQRRD